MCDGDRYNDALHLCTRIVRRQRSEVGRVHCRTGSQLFLKYEATPCSRLVKKNRMCAIKEFKDLQKWSAHSSEESMGQTGPQRHADVDVDAGLIVEVEKQ